MEDWIEALSLILKIFTAYTAVISIFFLLPEPQRRREGQNCAGRHARPRRRQGPPGRRTARNAIH